MTEEKFRMGLGPLGKPMVKVPLPNSPVDFHFNPPSTPAPKTYLTKEIWYVKGIQDDMPFYQFESNPPKPEDDLEVLWHGQIDIGLWNLLKETE